METHLQQAEESAGNESRGETSVRVVIVGAGEVGSTIAESLADTHEVIVIDLDRDRVEALTYSLDVLPVEGDGASIETLTEAGAESADMVIACTDDDETNIVCCGTVRTLSEAFTIARVRNTKFLDTWERSDGALGVDLMVGTNLLTARSIVQVIGLPAARDVHSFADGLVQMAEFEVTAESPIAGKTVAEADRFDSLTFAAIIREEDVVIPRGSARLMDGAEVVVIGSTESVDEFADSLDPDDQGVSDVLIVGGSDIGHRTAHLLGRKGLKSIRRELFATVHPEAVTSVRLGGRALDEQALRGIYAFTLLYVVVFFVGVALVTLDSWWAGYLAADGLQLYDAIGSVAATLGNVGPAFGVAGPMGNYLGFPPFSKLLMVFLMWIGRLEILPVFVLLTVAYWRS